MVSEDDPLWVQFWAAYPRRVAKKDARRAWALLQPTRETVDKMLVTLEWQQRAWSNWDYIPYPASWLRAERWTDEPQTTNGNGHAVWGCPHVDRCDNRQMCAQAVILGRPVRES